uniref:DDE Tnp4 domain-containing protein n=1 Tax=Photinus pyralis TaxID=7054 RepID=A0A1Y1LAJ7_PHOPY
MSESSDSDIEDVAALALIGVADFMLQSVEKPKCRRRKTREWISRRQEGKGILTMLNSELLSEDHASYINYLRMTNMSFEKLLRSVESAIGKEDTVMCESISARNRLEITLRFLATGESYRSLMYSTRVHESTISRFIPEVCKAIYNKLKKKYLKMPTTEREWEKIAEQYYTKWDFPNCVGALDGRHIKFKAPHSSGSYYYNYKGTNSIILLGLVDAEYKFLYVNVGVNGRISDGGVYRESYLSQAIRENSINFPPAKALPGRSLKVPYVIVADDAFPLSERILKPYSSRNLNYECRIFNYRLSRARRMVESAFGILANRFRVLLNSINLSVDKVEVITLCSVVLHNFLITENPINELHGTIIHNTANVDHINDQQGGNRSSNLARNIRSEFKDFFNTVGARDWQHDQVTNNNM